MEVCQPKDKPGFLCCLMLSEKQYDTSHSSQGLFVAYASEDHLVGAAISEIMTVRAKDWKDGSMWPRAIVQSLVSTQEGSQWNTFIVLHWGNFQER